MMMCRAETENVLLYVKFCKIGGCSLYCFTFHTMVESVSCSQKNQSSTFLEVTVDSKIILLSYLGADD